MGLDRNVRSLLRLVTRTDRSSVIAIHGAPGSGKDEFVRRLAFLANDARVRTDVGVTGLFPGVVWYDVWSWSKQGNILAGLISAVSRGGVATHINRERARELASNLNRLKLDGSNQDVLGAAFSGLEADPVEALSNGFDALVNAARGGRAGRLLIIVDGMDRLSPTLRWQFLDGLTLLRRGQADVTFVISMGREAALSALRVADPHLSELGAAREMQDIIDIALTVPTLEVRRISSLLREFIGDGEAVIRRAFGRDAVMGLSAAVANRPLGAPRFLRRLSLRVILVAEYAFEVRAARELTEAQWAWVIISERWPHFRRFMIRGGRERWLQLKQVAGTLNQRNATQGRPVAISKWLEQDLILADYLRLHADGFERDAEGIYWLENLLLASGL